MKTATIIWAIIIVIVVAFGWYVYDGSFSTPAADVQNMGIINSPATNNTKPTNAQVTYGPNGFSPSTVTIVKGGTVTFVNQGGDGMWVASAPHPTHEGYSGTTRAQHCPDTTRTAFDQCGIGATYSFTFQKAGTWGYHNHGNPTDVGTVVVQ
ncbi:hypothetical protein A3G63_00620 [Candidatus Kaiserbacteria bacterium RIFCSPLOWO2_12_FULL_52_8]|uniref:EfeO-type cupredoxin-like domain-containing protein n=1 Tax=Candidatus Kaiserbacteria bacterium RIFCSPHIGHO2_01_FULL_53_31 TaxID=1798481 RepID=A0A1F6CIF7_9BACT|nr:MAG: hypothetical protein A2678_01090 [Candidatus Kaiserbacteria bacterium RIFCSPHIGHO2_01_FULL_53_31]OGG92665.1 MAG: hypothetical protein A3G63_00620 [Candidatus Kaiserbacteria bacterium RIFCSPLOWO2_12_FULL_52_8]